MSKIDVKQLWWLREYGCQITPSDKMTPEAKELATRWRDACDLLDSIDKEIKTKAGEEND